MAAALTLLLIGSLLLGALCGEFKALIPQTIEVLSGSCVTIPCSFEVPKTSESNLDNTCKAMWKKSQNVFNNPQHSTINGDLTKKDCTTTLSNMQPAHSNKYYFRVECKNLKYTFEKEALDISVKADPPRPTLTPSTLKVKEGTSVTLMCSAPALCLSHPPTLTWSPGLGEGQEMLQINQDKTKVKTSVVNFTASYHHHGKTMSCTATYNKQDGSTAAANSTSLTADISSAPQILPSSDCTKAAAQLRCSCRTVGNPFPTLQWYLDGLPINHSDKFVISKHLNDTYLRSIMTVNEPQKMDLSTLTCHSSNSLGYASHRFCVNSFELQTSAQRQDRVILPIFISTVVALLVLLFALLLVNRAQRTHHILLKRQHAAETSPAATSQLLTRGEGNKVPNTTEEDIYVNSNTLRQADVSQPATIAKPNTNLPSSGPNDMVAAGKSSGQMNEEGNEVIYSTVNWKTINKKREDCMEMYRPGSFYLEEERRGEKVKKKGESEYAQVKYKDKTVMNT